ncbi:RlpA-like double-psi beta-barrel-protein domain-containing protein-containing protein [Mycotypha africana]|uniref:RlpA-like double-psi beta-barrel-protein domain-containing protein-containing protein n=1 Tax=Mycotypha africana TaxID=64632 RepID=UPI002301B40B|nr:RlpA-like double-psi beta-barrel-protein domain-containing protein-containing protein [Mycotypha africana]KAI8981740.1 RlpA-like double-psi beta-barrel-protein domain-containing protein-containing protein [Mycotypha africana]
MQFQFIFTIFSAVIALSTLVAASPNASSEGSSTNHLAKRKTYTGTATWYKPATEGGPHAACNGAYIDDYSRIVALNAEQYGNMNGKSKYCHKKIRIKGPKGSATATILDACPGCSYGDLDLTPVLFKKIVGDMNKGIGKIHWNFV